MRTLVGTKVPTPDKKPFRAVLPCRAAQKRQKISEKFSKLFQSDFGLGCVLQYVLKYAPQIKSLLEQFYHAGQHTKGTKNNREVKGTSQSHFWMGCVGCVLQQEPSYFSTQRKKDFVGVVKKFVLVGKVKKNFNEKKISLFPHFLLPLIFPLREKKILWEK